MESLKLTISRIDPYGTSASVLLACLVIDHVCHLCRLAIAPLIPRRAYALISFRFVLAIDPEIDCLFRHLTISNCRSL